LLLFCSHFFDWPQEQLDLLLFAVCHKVWHRSLFHGRPNI
jgi:hypothetical protein